jgi:hypothetical protein
MFELKNKGPAIFKIRIAMRMFILAFCILISGRLCAVSQELSWPRQIESDSVTIVMYQPQLDSFKGNVMTGRLAISVSTIGKPEPVFGAMWVSAQVSIDRDVRLIDTGPIDVTRIHFPNTTGTRRAEIEKIIESEIPKWNITLSLDRVLADLEMAELEREKATDLNNDPPKIIYVDFPALLVIIDGEPTLRQQEGSQIMDVVNTPFQMVFDPATNAYYLFEGRTWVTASDHRGPWQTAQTIPAEVKARTPLDAEEAVKSGASTEPAEQPRIIVATEPTELIVTVGAAEFKPIQGTGLLYVSNTESDLFMDIGSQKHYLLLSGRWYKSGSLKGPWTHVPVNQLPKDFGTIPPESERANVRTFVAGTDEAEEAVLDAYLPQTNTVSRDQTIVVTYDGKPEFRDIPKTDLKYIANTSDQVIRVDDMYYCAREAAWYLSADPLGPWNVAIEIPNDINTIPAECPLYNVKYLQVYGYTDEVVHFGYTSGYLGYYVATTSSEESSSTTTTVIVYGTGYYYHPWVGTYYYAYPATWGHHVYYTPWVGWRLGFSYNSAYFHYAVWAHPAGYWGPHRYAWTPAGRYNPRGPYDPRGPRDPRGRYDPRGARDPRGRYDPRGPHDSRGGSGLRNPVHVAERPNNVYADKQGNVHRNTDKGWEQHTKDGWSKTSNKTSSKTSSKTSQLERDKKSRQQGDIKTKQRSSSTKRSRSGGRRSRR